jgi:hypothetical protein
LQPCGSIVSRGICHLAIGTPGEDDPWYYEIGGAEPVSVPANPAVNTVMLNGSGRFGLSKHAIEAIRAMSRDAQGIVVARLVRRLLLTGARVPEVAGYKAASNRVGDAVAEIEKDIDNLLFEADVRQKVVSNTLQVVLSRDEEVRKTAPAADRNPLINGRTSQ